ncbi:LDH2 family malate/lactate/ureidoglycolate dehydrogenase [Bradyrhizobium sp. USDA 4354]
MPIVKADRLTRISAALLRAAGASEEEADVVAIGCVNANLAGHDSHGVIAVPTYIDRIKAGHIVPGARVPARHGPRSGLTASGEQQHESADGTGRLPPGAKLHELAELLAAS